LKEWKVSVSIVIFDLNRGIAKKKNKQLSSEIQRKTLKKRIYALATNRRCHKGVSACKKGGPGRETAKPARRRRSQSIKTTKRGSKARENTF